MKSEVTFKDFPLPNGQTLGEYLEQPTSPATKPMRTASASREPQNQMPNETPETCDLRFTDPLVAEIVEVWRIRQDFHRAEKRLVLQIKAICRRWCEGDKTEADKLYRALTKGEADPNMMALVSPLFAALDTVTKGRADREKTLRKMAKDLPIYGWVSGIKGFGELGLAATVGECGDLSAYKSVSAVWKRAGLAVIDGGRQRRVSGDAALEHGFSPERRAVFWTLADSLLKAQGKDEKAGPYRQIYDARKAYERPRVESDGHAHNRAMRYMFKELLKDLTSEWKAISRDHLPPYAHADHVRLIAAE